MTDIKAELKAFIDFFLNDDEISEAIELNIFNQINVEKLLKVKNINEAYPYRIKDAWKAWLLRAEVVQKSESVVVRQDERDYINEAIALHAEMLKENRYCSFELTYTNQSKSRLLICSNTGEQDLNRKVLVKGVAYTLETACKKGLELYAQKNAIQSHN